MNQPVISWGAPRAERADAARNRRHLLATARQMLAEQGADHLTIDRLAERAGLGKGTVFRRLAPARESSRRCLTMTSGPSRSRYFPDRRRWARAPRRWTA